MITTDAFRFNCTESAPTRIEAAYKPDINDWNGLSSVQLLIEHFVAAV